MFIYPASAAKHNERMCGLHVSWRYSKYRTFSFRPTFDGLIRFKIMTSQIKGSVADFTCTHGHLCECLWV